MKLLDREELLEKEPTLEEEFAEITREVGPRRAAAHPVVTGHRFGRKSWLVVGLAVAAIAAIVIAVIANRGDDTTTELDTATELDTGAETPVIVQSSYAPFTEEDITLMRLARAGYIPRQAVDWELMELKGLVFHGHVPAESLVTPPRPLLTAAQRNPEIAVNDALLALYRANQIPREAVDWQLLELVNLVNERHVPLESLYITP